MTPWLEWNAPIWGKRSWCKREDAERVSASSRSSVLRTRLIKSLDNRSGPASAMARAGQPLFDDVVSLLSSRFAWHDDERAPRAALPAGRAAEEDNSNEGRGRPVGLLCWRLLERRAIHEVAAWGHAGVQAGSAPVHRQAAVAAVSTWVGEAHTHTHARAARAPQDRTRQLTGKMGWTRAPPPT